MLLKRESKYEETACEFSQAVKLIYKFSVQIESRISFLRFRVSDIEG